MRYNGSFGGIGKVLRLPISDRADRTEKISMKRVLTVAAAAGFLAFGQAQPFTAANPWSNIQTVFIILLENHDWSEIQGNPSAPYINTVLLPRAAHAEQYFNPTGIHPSLPNYLWLEAGQNFGILDDNNPSSDHQGTTQHFARQLENAGLEGV
jgi:hypothetical protein